MRRWVGIGLATAALLLLGVVGAGAIGGAELHGVFVYHVVRYTTWEDLAPGGELPVCVLDASKAEAIRQEIGGEEIGGRTISVEAGEADDCRVVYVPRGTEIDAEHLEALLAAPNVLSIGEGRDFIDRGGVVAFEDVGGKLRFEVSRKAARHAGLKLSSKLLRLASEVRD